MSLSGYKSRGVKEGVFFFCFFLFSLPVKLNIMKAVELSGAVLPQEAHVGPTLSEPKH